MWHSCRRMRVLDHLEGRPREIVSLYRYILSRVRSIGPIRLDTQGRGIAFQVRARSIGVMFHPTWIDLTLWLKRPASHQRLRRVEDFGPMGIVHHFRLDGPGDLDAELETLLAEAYAVGAQTAPGNTTTASGRPRRSARTSRR